MSETAAARTDNADSHDWPLVTVNILAYNRREDVRRTLQAIVSELDYPADRLEVIVVDNASEDETDEMVRAEFPSVTLLRRDRNVGVPGWNDGFRAGRGEYFLVLDDDCYITGDALKVAVSAALEEEADLVSFRVVSPWYDDFAFSELYRTGLLSFWGCSVLISRPTIERLGGFDPLIFVWSHELDFTARALDAGFRHLYLPEVEAVHLKRIITAPPRVYAAHLRHLAYFAGKSLRLRDAAGAVANLICRAAVSSVRRPSSARELIGSIAAGTWLGARHRAPLRPVVSRTYRRQYQDFVSLVWIMRGASERLRQSPAPTGGPELSPHQIYSARARAFFDQRPEIYPHDRGSLRL